MKLLLPLILAAALPWVLLAAAEGPAMTDVNWVATAGYGIAERLDAGGGGAAGQCWDALVELKACTNEIILFFFNGEAYLGKDCCKSIRTIMYGCWPSMLTSIGFTAKEADILRHYCGPPAPVPGAPPSAS
ncbi:hypothetical protein DM860_006748 [Cuscuta australis]|uniref:Prolamin-like domain-containing protein n=1 Tax=Cuscuta australis TaxID=267555 RepID=A0A328D877_9ASTE|nr:hypothetical protein DM860_006748 [Cuscuta australis]